MRRSRYLLLLASLGIGLLLPAAGRAAPKTDVVILANGDRITGEVRELDRGQLTYKTDSMLTLSIEWDDIVSVVSVNYFEFNLRNHRQYFGRLAETDSLGTLAIVTDRGLEIVPVAEVVSISRIKQGFWQRQTGSVDFGVTYQSANSLLQYNFSWSNKFRTKFWNWTIDLTTIETFQSEREPTSQRNLTSSFSRFLGSSNFVTASATAQSNRELGIDLRVLGSLSAGHRLVRTNSQELTTGLGLSANHEIASGGEPPTENLEALISAHWSVFKYNSPKRNLDVDLNVYPGLSEWGRLRLDLNAKMKIEVFSDFFFGLTALDNYDSRPPSGGRRNDVSLTFSLGYIY